MFRHMRKVKNEIGIDMAKHLLKTERRGVLSVNGDGGYPYAIPINFLYSEEDNKIYFHGSRVGHKVDSINACDKVCFTVFGNEQIKKEEWAPFVQSVVVFGRCRTINNKDLNKKLVTAFAEKYYPYSELVKEEVDSYGAVVQMFEIEIEHTSGKEIQEK
ncbi:MAG TPA: 5-nitroimidazole antibiotic resistance protein [Ruminococcaceae bacterium]|nr:5-nitroimidazole antibiotic resistance protein [Oscillospiraceae bacterium]